MRRSVWFWVFGPLAVVLACSSGGERAAPLSALGGSTNGGATSGAGTSSGAAGGAAAGRAGSQNGGASTLAGAGGAPEGGAPAVDPGVCSKDATWSSGQRLSISTAADDLLGAISPDELTIVWLAGSDVYYADRTSVSADFADAIRIPGGTDYFAGVSVTPDGLTLVGVRKDGSGFGELVRASRSDVFQGAPDEAPFAALYAAPAALRSSGPFADPVFNALASELLYSALDAGSDGVSTIYASSERDATGAWPWGLSVRGSALLSVQGRFRRPSALSSDELALFYWDEVASEQRVAFRAFPSAAFDDSVSLGNLRSAGPNANCDRLYYSAPGAAGVDLFVAALH